MILREYKEALSNIQKGDVSLKDISEWVERLQIDSSGSDFLRKKRLVTRKLIQHILREETDEAEIADLQNRLKETESWLRVPKETGYECIYTGCLFRCPRHQGYIQHLTTQHFTSSFFICNFNHKCFSRFEKIGDLKKHASQHSQSGTNPPTVPSQNQSRSQDFSQPCKCIICERQFPSVKKLLQHMNNDHSLETRKCVFKNCEQHMGPQFVSRHHFYREHTKKGLVELKEENLIDNVSNEVEHENVVPFLEEEEDSVENDDMEIDEQTEEQEDMGGEETEEADLTKMLANFFNELAHIKMVPQTTIQFIVDEILTISRYSRELQKGKIKKLMSSEGVSEKTHHNVLQQLQNDEFIKAQERLDSTHKREKFILKEFKVILPKEVILNEEGMKRGEKKESLMYIPIAQTFKTMMEDKTVMNLLVHEQNKPRTALLQDIKDGENFKQMEYFKINPEAKLGLLYSDAIEVANPLGAARGRNKLVEMFFTLGDFPKAYRSKVDRINLVLVVKEKVLKKYGYAKCYKPLIDDLINIERNGVLISKPFPRLVKMGVFLHIGDNLEQHSLGGWSICFSSGRVCRICKVLHSELNECLLEDKEFWTTHEYDRVVDQIDPLPAEPVAIEDLEDHLFDQIEEPVNDAMPRDESTDEDTEADESGEDEDDDEADVEDSGIRARCPFNKLTTFHSTYSFPQDCMHDVAEGIIAEDLLASIKILVSKKYFTAPDYNRVMSRIKYGHEEKPEEISLKAKRLKGKAMANFNHLRYFGMIIEKLGVDTKIFEEDSFKLVGMLIRATELLLAPRIQEYEVFNLKDIIEDYLEKRQDIFKNQNAKKLMPRMKPKHHNALHYWRSMLMFGPPTSYWTARYESKNRVAKMMANAAKNFVNVAKTVAIRQQFRQASILYRGIMRNDLVLPIHTQSKWDLCGQNSPLIQNILDTIDEDSVICNEVEYNGSSYRTEDVIILKVHNSDFLEVGLIMQIVVKNAEVYFIINRYRAMRHPHLMFFETLNHDEQLRKISIRDMVDFKSLRKHGSFQQFRFMLYHHVTNESSQE